MATDPSHWLHALEEFNHLTIRFFSVQDQVDTASPMGKAMFPIIGAMAALESSLISERVKAGMAAARAGQAAWVAIPHWTIALPRGIITRDRNLLPPGDAVVIIGYIRWLRSRLSFVCLLFTLICDAVRFLLFCLRPSPALAAENLFLRKQLTLYQERQTAPRRATTTMRFALVWLSRWFDWRQVLRVVQPGTLTRWHRQGFRLLWRWKSKPGRPQIPVDLQALIHHMACDNPTWGQERMANELRLKLGLRMSPRTVRKYLPKRLNRGPGTRVRSQRWATFVRNHAQAIIACDFCVVVTATFRMLYVFVVIEHASRRLLHVNVTAHPTAEWTLQQLREAVPSDHGYRFLIHDRGSIFSQFLDRHIGHLGLRVLKTPARAPQANAICERLLGTLRRKCLDFLIPLTANHLRHLLHEWLWHYNAGRPHTSLGPGIPQPPASLPAALQEHRHPTSAHQRVVANPVLGGLHHHYRLEEKAA